MKSLRLLQESVTRSEGKVLAGLKTPADIQAFLDDLPYSADDFYRCPLRVLRDRIAHCFDGALFAAAALCRLGHPPLIVDMLPNSRDDDHLLAVFRRDGYWGAVAKSNFAGLRFREPIHRNLRELVVSYFEQYYNVEGEKTLRSYTSPLNLRQFDQANWMTSDPPLDDIADRLGKLRTFPLLTRHMILNLSPMDKRSYEAGMIGVNEAGLFRPGTKAGD